MSKWVAAIGVVLVTALAAPAVEPPFVCFGNEPSWSLAFDTRDTARLLLPDEAPVLYRGTETRLDALGERVWRGRPAEGAGGDVVAFLLEAPCSDGMSDLQHPLVARVSLPDGRYLVGCCRIAEAPAADVPAVPAPTAAPRAPAAIEGPLWRLTRLAGEENQTALAGLANPPTVRFDAGHLQGFDGCNQLVGSYTIDGDRVDLSALAGTMMACPRPVMVVETAFKKALTGALRFTVADGQMTLTRESATEPALVFEAAPPPRIEGVTWKVTGYNNGRQAVVSPLIGTTLTVSFADGSVTGNAGCNTFRAPYTREENRLTIGPVAATRKVCKKNVMEQEREFLAAIESTTTWAVDRNMLDLHRADGERVLSAKSAK